MTTEETCSIEELQRATVDNFRPRRHARRSDGRARLRPPSDLRRARGDTLEALDALVGGLFGDDFTGGDEMTLALHEQGERVAAHIRRRSAGRHPARRSRTTKRPPPKSRLQTSPSAGGSTNSPTSSGLCPTPRRREAVAPPIGIISVSALIVRSTQRGDRGFVAFTGEGLASIPSPSASSTAWPTESVRVRIAEGICAPRRTSTARRSERCRSARAATYSSAPVLTAASWRHTTCGLVRGGRGSFALFAVSGVGRRR